MLIPMLLGGSMALASPASAAFTMPSIPVIAGLGAAVLPGLVSAINNIKMINHCPYDIYAWTVGPSTSNYKGLDADALVIPANAMTIHNMINTETLGGGMALKIRDLPKYQVAPAGIIQVEYHLEASKNNLWYDLSAIDCNHAAGPENPSYCPLIAGGMRIHVANADQKNCPPAWCGADGCHNTYTEHGFWLGEPTFKCNAGVDVVVEMCTERVGPRTFNGNAEPGLPAEVAQEVQPGVMTVDGICGSQSLAGATCFGYTHGNCCSSYGWCGFSEQHCGSGCQSDFGACFSSGLSSPSPSSSSALSDASVPTLSYTELVSTYLEVQLPTSSSAPSVIYATHTVTETYAVVTKTVAIGSWYSVPVSSTSYSAAAPTYEVYYSSATE